MSKSNRYTDVKFIYVYDHIFMLDKNNNEKVEKHPVAVICTGKVGTSFYGKVGVAICGQNDKFVYAKGKAIAYNRLVNSADIPLVGKSFLRNVKYKGKLYKVQQIYSEFMICDSNGKYHRINDAIEEILEDINSSKVANERFAEYLENPEIAEDWSIVKSKLDL